MTQEKANQSLSAAPAQGVDGAGGVEQAHWYAAYVNHNAERRTADRIEAQGVDTYIATQREMRVWVNGRRKMIDRVVIPSVVFVRCTEDMRRHRIVKTPGINRFLTNKAAAAGTYGSSVAIIPEREMATLRFMLGNADTPVDFTPHTYTAGDRVRVLRGPLRGLEGIAVRTPDTSESTLHVALGLLGCATVALPLTDLEPA